MKIRCSSVVPFQNMVAIQFDVISETSGGLLLPDGATQAFPARRGTVYGIGRGGFFENGERRTIDLSIGDSVIAAGFGLVVDMDGVDVELINVDNVLAVVR